MALRSPACMSKTPIVLMRTKKISGDLVCTDQFFPQPVQIGYVYMQSHLEIELYLKSTSASLVVLNIKFM